MRRVALMLLAMSQTLPHAYSEPLSSREANSEWTVPEEDIFGFTSPSEVGDVGDTELSLETDGRLGKRGTPYGAIAQKLEFSRTIGPDLSSSIAIFGDRHSLHSESASGAQGPAPYAFDGLSGEIRARLLRRAPDQPLAITLAIEPRWGRVDGLTGMRATSYSAETKLEMDARLGPHLFWGANLGLTLARQRDADTPASWSRSSDRAITSALTYEAREDTIFFGLEGQWLQTYQGVFFGQKAGSALFLGPTALWKPTKRLAINVVALPQIAGHAQDVRGSLDLTNFERMNLRLKLAYSF